MSSESDTAKSEQAKGLDIRALLEKHQGRNYDLHAAHVNPANVRALRTIGFDRCYVRAAGPYLWDVKGTKYLDMLSGYGVFALGRNHPEIRRVLTEFLQQEYPSLVKLEAPLLCGLLAEELKKRMPNQLEMVFFTNSGAEGIETAIKYARCATGKPAILHCQKAFHGLTYGALSLNGDASFREGFAPFLTDCRLIPFNDLEALERELRKKDVAALVMEPVQGKGVNLPNPGYLAAASRLCHEHGALLVDDEVKRAWDAPGASWRMNMRQGSTRILSCWPRAFQGALCPWERCSAESGSTRRCFRACNDPSSTAPLSARAVSPWWLVWRRWMCWIVKA